MAKTTFDPINQPFRIMVALTGTAVFCAVLAALSQL